MNVDLSLPNNVHVLTEREKDFIATFRTSSDKPMALGEFLKYWNSLTDDERHDLWSKHWRDSYGL